MAAKEVKDAQKETTLHPLADALGNILDELETRDETGSLRCWFSGETDSNQSTFEILTTQGLICVLARDKFEACVLFVVLRALIDDNPFVLDDFETGESASLQQLADREEYNLSLSRPELNSKKESIGTALATVMGVSTAPVVWDFEKVLLAVRRRRLAEGKAAAKKD